MGAETTRRYERTAPIGVARSLAERLWEKTANGPGCWMWLGAVTNRYGILRDADGRGRRTHRVAWEVTNGPIPPGMYVCHRCDTPLCVRPDHLFLGTSQDNHADMVAKGRHRVSPLPGCSNPRSKLRPDQVRRIRDRLRAGESAPSIARDFPVCTSVVQMIRSGKHYSSVPDNESVPESPSPEGGDGSARAQVVEP